MEKVPSKQHARRSVYSDIIPSNSYLEVFVIEARLYRNTEIFGEMDPYVVLNFRGKNFKTRAIDEGGKNPKWNETLILPINSGSTTISALVEEQIKIVCLDEELLIDDMVGSTMIKVKDLLDKKEWIKIQYEGKDCGEILFETRLVQPHR
jgi:Ca2+-dependent lipid-binding protein